MSSAINPHCQTFISVPFNFYHKHFYKNAPAEVEFLQVIHPHDFKCKASLQVFDDDRELEFYLVREFLNSKISYLKKVIGDQSSCEMIAEEIYKILVKKYGMHRIMQIEVSEDGLYSATKIYLGRTSAS